MCWLTELLAISFQAVEPKFAQVANMATTWNWDYLQGRNCCWNWMVTKYFHVIHNSHLGTLGHTYRVVHAAEFRTSNEL